MAGDADRGAAADTGAEVRSLRWRCRRGMRELDVLLSGYLEHRYASLDAAGKAAFRDLLELQDPEIFGYLLGRKRPDDPRIADIVTRVLERDSPPSGE